MLQKTQIPAETSPRGCAIPSEPSRKSGVFYGYWIVAVAFFCAFVQSGCGFYSFSLFVRPLQDDFGWGRGEIMLALTLYFLSQGVSAPIAGRLVDRYRAKNVISIAAVFTGLSFVLLSQVNTLRFFYAFYVTAGLGMAASGLVPGSAVVSNWFKRRRGIAIGIMSAGVGGGGLVLAPLVGAYITPHFGWRTSYLVLAVLTWSLIPLAIFVLKTRPEDMGLWADGAAGPGPATEQGREASDPGGLPLKAALTTSTFWLIAVSFFAHGFSEVGVLQTQVPHLEDIGFPVAKASTAFGVVGLCSLLGKFGFGWLCDRIHAKYACTLGLVMQMVGLLILMTLHSASPSVLLYLYAVVIGLGVGSWLPAMSILVSTNFGLTSYGALFGITNFMLSSGASTGPLMAGSLFDRTGNYDWAFIVFIIVFALAIPPLLAARRPRSF